MAPVRDNDSQNAGHCARLDADIPVRFLREPFFDVFGSRFSGSFHFASGRKEFGFSGMRANPLA